MKLEQLSSQSFWQDFAGEAFHISNEAKPITVKPAKPKAEILEETQKLFKLEGYAHLYQQLDLELSSYISLLKKMFDADIPPVFAFVYDEFWELQARLRFIVESFLGEGSKLMPTVWIWYVDPAREREILQEENKELVTRTLYSGFYGPHRDKGKKGLYPDGSPKILSFWLPLTEANSLNSCIYLIPANRDPTYNTEEEESWLFKRPDIRALPAKPGDILFWNEAVVHWGSRPAPERKVPPRISIGFEYISKDCLEKCTHFDIDTLPDFKTRLEIIALQFKLYITSEGFPSILIDFIKAHDRLVRSGKEEF